ncbi:PPOX class F420-dependent oxidoreductase [Planotetraspora sp. A-T 1434]|uniref:PPOX class F420-dependent oxidoreductase n=1 Tax=Planotetraspora sp. A-T 1434 TaxID=2979219 RepID=UPI0021BE697A|nr:PPOX class F420-dependent oxidoreductase [Planotetraspora sp. A-T 1434]MCT9930788.1 PPOX class F420-dependent oxidoreductase [Planotetraspora sp. A-T 1434]
MTTPVERLGAEKYVSVVTFRRDGTPVATPVWAVRDGDALVVWTVRDSGKVKRIRNNPEVTVAPCDIRGRLRGEAVRGRAELLPDERIYHVGRLVMGKYGLAGRLTIWTSRLRRGPQGTIGVRIVLD